MKINFLNKDESAPNLEESFLKKGQEITKSLTNLHNTEKPEVPRFQTS